MTIIMKSVLQRSYRVRSASCLRLSRVLVSVVEPLQSKTSAAARPLSISRMLDMGGMPSAQNDNKQTFRLKGASKNSHIQAVAFDFDLLVNIIQEEGQDETTTTTASTLTSKVERNIVEPNIGMVKQMASLLNIDLDGGKEGKIKKDDNEKDDLSLLTGEKTTKNNTAAALGGDIRSKYADKLRKRGVEGGIATLDLNKDETEQALARGDAEGHFAARKLALSAPSAGSSSSGSASTRWMAMTGSGKLLGQLTQRSIKIALIPTRQSLNDADTRMNDLTRQLKNVVFDVLVSTAHETAQERVRKALKEIDLEAKLVLFISDQDEYLRMAKEVGMMTCRIRPLNARRGNVSAHFTIESVMEVQQVIHEMNGISYK